MLFEQLLMRPNTTHLHSKGYGVSCTAKQIPQASCWVGHRRLMWFIAIVACLDSWQVVDIALAPTLPKGGSLNHVCNAPSRNANRSCDRWGSVGPSPITCHAFRLRPGEELKEALVTFTSDVGIRVSVANMLNLGTLDRDVLVSLAIISLYRWLTCFDMAYVSPVSMIFPHILVGIIDRFQRYNLCLPYVLLVQAGFVISCVGSVRNVVVRLAGAERPRPIRVSTTKAEQSREGSANSQHEQPMLETGPDARFEVLSLVGTLSPDGSHLHISLGDEEGRVCGGHLVRATVHTTAEIVVGQANALAFSRVMDEETGFKELVVSGRDEVDEAGRTPHDAVHSL